MNPSGASPPGVDSSIQANAFIDERWAGLRICWGG